MDPHSSPSQLQKQCERLLKELNLSACIILGWHEGASMQYVYAVHGMSVRDVVGGMSWLMQDYTHRVLRGTQASKTPSPTAMQTLCSQLLNSLKLPGFIALCVRKKEGGYRAIYATRKVDRIVLCAGVSWALARFIQKNLN